VIWMGIWRMIGLGFTGDCDGDLDWDLEGDWRRF